MRQRLETAFCDMVGIAARNHRFINILNPASMTARDSLSFMADFGLNGRISLFSEGDKRALNTTFNLHDDFVEVSVGTSLKAQEHMVVKCQP